jgi:phosphate:Na+ symporter
VLLDRRLLLNPPFAVDHCKTVTNQMAEKVRESLYTVFGIMREYDSQKARLIEGIEDEIDSFEDKLGTYLVEISSKSLTLADSRKVSMLLQNIGDFERMADHSLNILKSIQEMNEKKIDFSEAAWKDIDVVEKALTEIIELAINSFINEDLNSAHLVEPLEEVIDTLVFEMKSRHTLRVREGQCNLELGFIFADLATNFERISDHCSNIAVCLIEVDKGSFDTHEYLKQIKSATDSFFSEKFEMYKKKYTLP